MSKNKTTVKVELPAQAAAALKNPEDKKRVMSFVRRSHEQEIKLTSPTEFFKDFEKPTHSKLYDFVQQVKKDGGKTEFLDQDASSRIMQFNLGENKWNWQGISNTPQLLKAIEKSETNKDMFVKLRESREKAYMKKHYAKEDMFGGFGFADDQGAGSNGGNYRSEYSPLIGTPFFKQLYLYDYLLMHSKAFWYRNYSGIAKLIIDMTRTFVIGKGFSVTVNGKDKNKVEAAESAWKHYEDRSMIHEDLLDWTDELTTFGEHMLKKVPTAKGLIHKSVDPSTIWEIVTDPENIRDIKYYHQQYSTQYQLFATKDAPITKYIINQIPPQQMIHTKINCTTYEKRGRSDLLAAMLYLKYFEDYMQAKTIRAKNECAFLWDVSVKGAPEDLQAYIDGSEDIANIPPASDFIHNEAITRTPIAPSLGKASNDETAKWILSYICMSTSLPTNYLGTFESGGFTKAGALVATEPVVKKMEERRLKIEQLLHKIFDDVMADAGIDNSDIEPEFNFPELIVEDRSKKIQDVITLMDQQVIAHETGAEILAKEMNISTYDYETEQEKIKDEINSGLLTGDLVDPEATGGGSGGGASDLTTGKKPNDNQGDKKGRSFDRSAARKDNSTL